MPTEIYDTLGKGRKNRRCSVVSKKKEDNKSVRMKDKEDKKKKKEISSNEESVYSRLHVPAVSSSSKRKNKGILKDRSKETLLNRDNVNRHQQQQKMTQQQQRDHKVLNPKTKPKTDHPDSSENKSNRGIEGAIETSPVSLRPENSKVNKKSQDSLKHRGDKKWDKMIEKSMECSDNKVSEYRDTNKIAKALWNLDLVDESRLFAQIITERFNLEEEFLKINLQDGIRTVEGDYDKYASNKHSSIGGLKIEGVPKGYVMVDEYDPKILKKNSEVLKDYEHRATLIHQKALQNQVGK